jgi:hypothetical protein
VKKESMRRFLTAMAVMLFVLISTSIAQSEEWQPVTGEENLRNFMSGTTLEWEEPGAGKNKGEYRADGTGTLHTFGAPIPRTWEVKGDDQISVKVGKVIQSWRLERNTADPTLYRSIDVATGRITEIRMSKDGATATVKGGPKAAGNKGGPAAASASEIAAQLANPSSPLAALNFNLQFRSFKGDLPGANDESSTSLLFQPQFPFALKSGNQVIFRPAISVLADQPVFDVNTETFDSEAGLSDISFDLLLSRNLDTGYLIGAGIFSTIPTATTSDLSSGLVSLGPEFVLAKLTPDYVLGALWSHEWDVSGWKDGSVNRTTISAFANLLLAGGSTLGSNPIISYNWDTEEWTVPLTLSYSKTLIIGQTPWKIGLDLNYYVEQPDAFGPEWMLSLNITPVVSNFLASWLGMDGEK